MRDGQYPGELFCKTHVGDLYEGGDGAVIVHLKQDALGLLVDGLHGHSVTEEASAGGCGWGGDEGEKEGQHGDSGAQRSAS